MKLLSALEARGWQLRDGSVYAPGETIWLLSADPWTGDLKEFHERMCERLARIEAHRWMYQTDGEHQPVVADTRSLVEVLAFMLAG